MRYLGILMLRVNLVVLIIVSLVSKIGVLFGLHVFFACIMQYKYILYLYLIARCKAMTYIFHLV